ncbi:hypothetical protein [Brachybacterium sp. YJGR34]|uniref:hypothetical protein n=1 Tax=Brachybacterium sp. YJGR34 TaxID=2059911 RepID=UPI000E0B471C|nr:hypothetical protein [Brachybacterium sp. YJGR34]
MLPLRTLLDPLADLLLGLRRVSPAQWALRLIGAAGMMLALMGALPMGLFANFLTVLVTLLVGGLLLIQMILPDTDLGIGGPLLVLLALAGQEDLSPLRAGGVGLALLASHAAFALAATTPAHGVLEPAVWRLGLRSLLPVLALAVLGAVVVLAVSGLRLGPWTLVVGILAAIGLFVAVLPRAR